jgi:hypothetical protein
MLKVEIKKKIKSIRPGELHIKQIVKEITKSNSQIT